MNPEVMVEITQAEYDQLRADQEELKVVRSAIAILISQVLVEDKHE